MLCLSQVAFYFLTPAIKNITRRNGPATVSPSPRVPSPPFPPPHTHTICDQLSIPVSCFFSRNTPNYVHQAQRYCLAKDRGIARHVAGSLLHETFAADSLTAVLFTSTTSLHSHPWLPHQELLVPLFAETKWDSSHSRTVHRSLS